MKLTAEQFEREYAEAGPFCEDCRDRLEAYFDSWDDVVIRA